MEILVFFIQVALSFNSIYVSGKPNHDTISTVLPLINPWDIAPNKSTEFSYLVSLRINDSHFCSGSLITSRHVITAAHCVYTNDSQLVQRIIDTITVVAGFAGGESFIQKVSVKRVSTHPDYVHDHKTHLYPNDIAIVTLRRPIEKSIYVEPLRHPNAGTTIPVSDEFEHLVASGFGRSLLNETLTSYIQRFYAVEVGIKRCKESFSMNKILDTMICVEKGAVDYGSWSGDSGGPLVTNKTLMGVFSYGGGYRTIFTKVSKYIPWIEFQIDSDN